LSTSLSSASASSSAAAASPSSSSLTKKRQRTTDDLLHWRRYQVVKLLAQGFTIDQTAEKLQVSPKTVQRDYAYIRHHASEVIRNYLEDTAPNEMLKALARLNAVSDAAWAMYARAKEKR
jgi:FixJ family two-component response regulator